ncbi:hypothetical protein HPB50_006935 [Hyalomma asiaticum]|uniref:Uncharacterized protein n=1 Tax=Hyalomma asiaticum TaxID=266040 RepID=A0ACB7T6N0_HYAAI|nr:hypothetical protein HPB50_006935 [Hyalomma asiaticum]
MLSLKFRLRATDYVPGGVPRGVTSSMGAYCDRYSPAKDGSPSEYTARTDSQATMTSHTVPTSILRREVSTLPSDPEARAAAAARRQRFVRIRSPAWRSSPMVRATPHLSRADAVVVEAEEGLNKKLLLVCMLLALVGLCGVLLILFIVLTARPAKLVYPLVCTVSSMYNRSVNLPRDGLCGYIFFESLYKGGANSLATRLSHDVDAFADRARHNTFTEFGMSFAIDNAKLVTEYTTPAFERGLDTLAQKQVIHYGFLDMHLQMTTNDTVAQALTILKRVNDHLAKTSGTRTRQSLMAIAMSLDDTASRPYVVNLMKTIFKPHLFIAMAHIPYRDADRPDCTILPSSVHHYPAGVKPAYGHTMNDSLALLQYLEDEQVFTSMAVGVTMKGRWYKVSNPSSSASYNLFERCTAFSGSQDFAPADACAGGSAYSALSRNYDYNGTLFAGFTYNTSAERVLVFDSKKGIKYKFCDLKQHYLNLSYGVAAYDVEFDAPQNLCTFLGIDGPYSRVDFLTRLRDFISQNYTSVASKVACDQESTARTDSQATTTSHTVPTSILRREVSTLPSDPEARAAAAARRQRFVRIRSPAWRSSPMVRATPHLSRADAVVVEAEEGLNKKLLLVCVLLALVGLCGVLLILLIVLTARPARLLYPYPLVCTVSSMYNRSVNLPRDGLCDYIFFESLYKGGANSLSTGLSQDVTAFADRARHNTFTEFGMSFAIDNAKPGDRVHDPAFERGLDGLVQKQVIHYGFLDMHLQMTTNDTVAQALTILKRVNDHLAKTSGTRTRQSLMVIAMSLDDTASRPYVVNLMKTIFKPHLFIAMAHIPYRDADRPDCTILPSSVHHYPAGVKPAYGHTMNDSLALLQYLEDEQVFTSMAVGVTMKGRWYKVSNPSSSASYNLFERCTAFSGSQDFAPADACAGGSAYSALSRNYDYNGTLFAGFTYNTSAERVLVFDSKKGIKYKFCDLKQHYLNLSYGVAAYDVEFDAPQHLCALLGIDGPYSRVDFLTRLRDFISRNYTSVANKAACDQGREVVDPALSTEKGHGIVNVEDFPGVTSKLCGLYAFFYVSLVDIGQFEMRSRSSSSGFL